MYVMCVSPSEKRSKCTHLMGGCEDSRGTLPGESMVLLWVSVWGVMDGIDRCFCVCDYEIRGI